MKKLFLVTALLFEIAMGMAQTDDASKYAAVITIADLQKHLTIIAGEEMEGRETGTDGQRKAATYIEAQFKAIGLQIPTGMTGYQQFYPLHRDTMLNSSLSIAGYTAEYGIDYMIPRANTSGTFTSNEIVFAGYGIEDEKYNDYAGLDVKGKLVIIFLGEPKAEGIYLITGKNSSSDWTYPGGLSKKLSLAKTKGAAGLLVINPAAETFSKRSIDDSKHSNLYYPAVSNGEEDKKINYALISHRFAKTLFADRFDGIIKKATAAELFPQSDAWNKTATATYAYDKKTTIIYASNVLGMLEGTDKQDEYVFLTGHYDHLGKRDGKIYYGADDDGSGTVGVIEMAAAFATAKAEGKGPRRTIIFMTVSGEEKGLLGSQYYSEHPVFPLEKTSVDLNTDMVGRIDTERETADSSNYIYVVGHDKISSELSVINESVNDKYTKLKLDYKFDDPKDPERIYFRSDHYNFARKGVPVLFFYDGMLKADYHKPTDTVDKINWTLYEKRVRLIFHTAWEIANRKKMLKRDKPLSSETR
ncbi:MAG: M28 family peptidase [Ferruginibacter sp.]